MDVSPNRCKDRNNTEVKIVIIETHDIHFIKQLYEKFKNTNEENIKNHVVTRFLEMLGYNAFDFYYEHQLYHRNGRADIAIKINDYTFLYVEVKSPYNKLDIKEQAQLASYLFDRGLEWGILTNGRNYILFNNNITSLPNPNRSVYLDKVVFNIDIFNKTQLENIKYFSKESIFDTKVSNYFRDIAQYKALKYPNGGSSWNVYKGTLYNFFKYYVKQQGKYRNLEQIRVDEFEEFLSYEKTFKNETKKGKRINSVDTFENKYSHIRSFYQTMKKYNKISSHHFEEEKKKLIQNFDIEEKKQEVNHVLNNENISLILDFYSNQKDAIRNKTIFLLCLAFGLERSTLIKLNTSNIRNNKLILDNRELVLPPVLEKTINELIIENKQKNIRNGYLFNTKYNKQYKVITEGTINSIFDVLRKINKEFSVLSPSFIRTNLIKRLFYNGYSIEEIVYLTGTDLVSLSKIISYEEILEQIKAKNKKGNKNHPFKEFLYERGGH